MAWRRTVRRASAAPQFGGGQQGAEGDQGAHDRPGLRVEPAFDVGPQVGEAQIHLGAQPVDGRLDVGQGGGPAQGTAGQSGGTGAPAPKSTKRAWRFDMGLLPSMSK